jgi:hypothetical protein
MGQQTIGGADLTARREQYRTLVGERLPAAAGQAGDWPIHQDHCFARVVLDNVFQGVWYDHVDGRPAYEHLSADDLDAAIDIAERLLRSGAPLVTELNERSLRWRDEL